MNGIPSYSRCKLSAACFALYANAHVEVLMIEGAGSLKWDSDCSTTMIEGAGRAATVLFV